MEPQQRVEHRLAAILSADVQGYSRLMAEAETATVRTLNDYRQVMGEAVRQHRGRVVDMPGDNLLAEFPSAIDAAQSAIGSWNLVIGFGFIISGVALATKWR